MKGKMINVRGENIKKINDNQEFIDIKKILGLENNKIYKDTTKIWKSIIYDWSRFRWNTY